MLRRFHPVLACAAGLTATAAMAQTAPVALTAGQAQKQAFDFVRAYSASTPKIDQIPRWSDPICAQVIGLPADQAAQVKARIEDVAQAVGLAKARPGCGANVQIVFTAQPQAVMDDVAKRREQLLGYNHRHQRDRLKTVTHPIQAWYVTATLGGGNIGGALFNPTGPLPGGMQVHREVIDDPDNAPPVGCGDNPHFSACLQSAFKNVFVVADVKALDGKELGLLADYLVMVTLSQPRSLDDCYALSSVIDVLTKSGCPGRDAPDGLTPGDAAYLTALYSADLQAKKGSQVGDIAGRMAKILTKASARR